MGQVLIVLFAFIWVVIASNQVAKFFQKIKLPLITGFLLSGLLIGPFGLDLIQIKSIENLHFVNNTSLAFIALAAGSELYLKEIRNSIRSILWNTIGHLTITFIIVSVSVFFLEDFIPFMASMNVHSRIAIAILSGTIFIAKSPSSVIAVLNELRAKGPFTKMVISVTVILDVLVIFLFTICLTVANNLIHGTNFDVSFGISLIVELVIIFIIGFLFAKILTAFLALHLYNYIKAIIILILGFGIYEFSNFIEILFLKYFELEVIIEPLLICIISSFFITNYSKYRKDLDLIIKEISPIVYAAFFTLAGATLSIDILAKTWSIALLIFSVYMIALIISSFASNTIAKNPKLYGEVGWMPFITQAGVGFALVYEVALGFPEWGNQFATIIIAVIVLNQLIGPPLFKWAIKLVRESNLPIRTSDGSDKNALIFGLEHQSLGLARDLQNENYTVEIASVERRKNIPHIKDLKIHFLEGLSIKCLNAIQVTKFHTVILMLSDGENYKVCRLLYNNFGTKIIIVRLFDSIYAHKFSELGALVVDPSTAISKLIEQFVRSPISASFIFGEDHKKVLVDIKVRDKNLHRIALRDLRLPPDVLILSVKRKGQMLISHGYTRLRKGDIVTIVGSRESLENLTLQFEE
ncbi:cation:proton antiporter [Bacteroidota bacterium]